MKVILVASIVLFGAYAVSSDKQGLLEETKDSNAALARSDREVPADYEPLGCFDWKNIKQQKLIVKPFLEKVQTKLSAEALESCVEAAKRKIIQLFGIRKKKGKILCLEVKDERWNGNAKVSHTCIDNIGTGKSIFIYRQSPIQACSEGIKPGDFWFNRVKSDSCFHCRCLYGNIEHCEKVNSFSCRPLNCENPIAHSKSCCLTCANPEASTQRVYSIKSSPTTEMELPWYS